MLLWTLASPMPCRLQAGEAELHLGQNPEDQGVI